MAEWLAPRPRRKRPGYLASMSATDRDTSSGDAAQTLTIPLATVTWSVAASIFSKCVERPGSNPPDDHNAVYPTSSISVAAAMEAPSPVRHEPLHQMPTGPRSTPRIVPTMAVPLRLCPLRLSHLTCDHIVTYPSDVAEDDLVFRALADPTRRFLLDRLFESDGRTLTELESELEMTRFGVMKHLRLLEDAGLVVTRRSGREKLHFLNPVPIRLIHDRWIDKYTERHVSALIDLKTQLEQTT